MVNKVAYALLGVVLSVGVAVLALFSLVVVVVGSAWAAHLNQFRWTLVGTAIGVTLAGTPYLLMTI